MTRVLFVDDEQRILRGLRRMLSQLEGEWQVGVALGGREALELLAKRPFDIVVSDMRMPEMNGNELLRKVRELYPEMARIILSGHSDEQLIMESTLVAHRYLSKPCDPALLVATIEECSERALLKEAPKLARLISEMTIMPSVPSLYCEIVNASELESTTMRDIGAIVSQDVSMMAKILQLVNSAFFGIRREVSCIEDAVGFIGIETLKSLVLSVKLFSCFEQGVPGGVSPEAISRHSLAVGKLARVIAQQEGAERQVVDHAFLAGCLHDAGRVLLLANAPKLAARCARLAREEGASLPEVELRELGATHAQLGAHLLGLWGLPGGIVSAIAHHHAPSQSSNSSFDASCAVHIAEACLALVADDEGDGGDASHLDVDYIESLGLSDRIEVWRSLAEEARDEAA